MRFKTIALIALALAWLTPAVQAQGAAELLSRHAELREQLASNPFGRPLHMESEQARSRLEGDVYAEIGQPYATVSTALRDAGNWCDILILHINTKSCRAFSSRNGEMLNLHIGRKTDQPLTSTQPIDFNYDVTANTPQYLQVVLEAEEGPLGTSNYRILLEVAQVNASTSFMHLSYSYSYSMMAGVAMRGYLATKGRDKVGFSVVGQDNDGKPKLTGGMRGVVERNTMRYYLAIEAFLGALATPPAQQEEKRLNDWFSSSEHYPLQLHEMERGEYLAMKRDEIRRQNERETEDKTSMRE